MEVSPIHCCRSHSAGLTLIEVMIALAIIAIAMTAIIKSTTQNIRSTAYLQNKTIAMWVGEEVLNEARVGLLKLPDPPDKRKDTTTVLGQTWYWQASREATPNKNIYKMMVKVFAEDNEEATPVIEMETYRAE